MNQYWNLHWCDVGRSVGIHHRQIKWISFTFCVNKQIQKINKVHVIMLRTHGHLYLVLTQMDMMEKIGDAGSALQPPSLSMYVKSFGT